MCALRANCASIPLGSRQDRRSPLSLPRKVAVARKLVIVESPAKARTIGAYLGKDFDVEAFDNADYGRHLMEQLAQRMGGEGEYAVFVGKLTNVSHNQWVDAAIEYQKQKGTTCIMRYWEPDENKLHKTGVAEVDENGRILRMEEKPAQPKSNWCTPPFYIYRAGVKAPIPVVYNIEEAAPLQWRRLALFAASCFWRRQQALTGTGERPPKRFLRRLFRPSA